MIEGIGCAPLFKYFGPWVRGNFPCGRLVASGLGTGRLLPRYRLRRLRSGGLEGELLRLTGTSDKKCYDDATEDR